MSNDGGGASRSTDPASGTSSATDVSLREFVEALRRGDSDRSRERLIWLIALGGFTWSQIQRRLEILNHENARVAAIAEKTVSGDTYKSDEERRSDERAKLDDWRKEVDSDRSRAITRDEFNKDTRLEREYRRGNWSLGAQLAAVAAAVVGAALLLFTTYRAIKPAIPSNPSTTTVFVQTTTTVKP